MHTKLAPCFLAVAIGLAVGGLAPRANAGGPAGGFATALGQLQNYIELANSYQENVRQVIDQAQMVVTMKQQLQNLPNSFIQQMRYGGGNVLDIAQNDTGAMESLIGSLQSADADAGTLSKTYQTAYNTLSKLHSEGIQADTAQYEAGMMELAKRKGSAYAQQVLAFQEAKADFQKQTAAVQSIASAAPNITSTIGGLQGIMQSNAVISSQLAGIGGQLADANVLTAVKGEDSSTKQCQARASKARSAASQVALNNVLAAELGGTLASVPSAPTPGSCHPPSSPSAVE
ncbi:MAG TPA: hypothetical protein VFQ88_09545 [Nevskiaceae bacterium]|nr:hypothetical protein [Nevskiaceae bacterium]